MPSHSKCTFTLPSEIKKNTSSQHCGEWSIWH